MELMEAMVLMIKKIILFISLLLILPVSSFATNYYVKNGGNDANTGLSDAQAWETMDKVDGFTFATGDDIYFKQDDTWTDSDDIDLELSGQSGNYSIIGCYESDDDFECSGARPIIQSSSQTGAVITFHSGEYLRFENLDLRNTNANWNEAGVATSNGITTEAAPTGNEQKGHIIITNCNFYHFAHYSIQLAQVGDNNIITNNTFDQIGNAIYFVDEGTQGGSYNYIADNVCTNIIGYVSVGEAESTRHDGHCAGLQRLTKTIIENNTSTDSFGTVYISWVGNDTEITREVVYRNNKSYTSGTLGINIGGGNTTDDAYAYVYGNILTQTSTPSFDTYTRAAIRVQDIHNVYVFNNTVYDAAWATTGLKQDNSVTSDIYFVNNIFMIDANDEANNGTDYFTDHQGTLTNITYDYNLYYTVDDGDPTLDDRWRNLSNTLRNWEEWNSAGFDSNGSVANPNFTLPGSNDFTLTSSSTGAVDQGRYLTYVTACSETTITVADNRWFHGDFGLLDEDGNAVTGMEISFYDTTNGIQNKTITTDEITYAAPGSFTIDSQLTGDTCQTGGDSNPANTTQVALTFVGSTPDIGALEYDMAISGISPANGATGISTDVTISWTNPTGTTGTKLFFDSTEINSTPWTTIATYDPTLVVDTTYYWRVDIIHAGGTETGTVYNFTTASGPPIPEGRKPTLKYSLYAGSLKYSRVYNQMWLDSEGNYFVDSEGNIFIGAIP